jgi:hypothetical protein
MRGPLGKGFTLPANVGRLALAALGESPARLLPLAFQTREQGGEIVLFCDKKLPALPADIEVLPLKELPDGLEWANYLAMDLPAEAIPTLKTLLGSHPHNGLPCPAQALVTIPMPCAGVGECNVCAIRGRRKWKLVCKDGPAFNLEELRWQG